MCDWGELFITFVVVLLAPLDGVCCQVTCDKVCEIAYTVIMLFLLLLLIFFLSYSLSRFSSAFSVLLFIHSCIYLFIIKLLLFTINIFFYLAMKNSESDNATWYSLSRFSNAFSVTSAVNLYENEMSKRTEGAIIQIG